MINAVDLKERIAISLLDDGKILLSREDRDYLLKAINCKVAMDKVLASMRNSQEDIAGRGSEQLANILQGIVIAIERMASEGDRQDLVRQRGG